MLFKSKVKWIHVCGHKFGSRFKNIQNARLNEFLGHLRFIYYVFMPFTSPNLTETKLVFENPTSQVRMKGELPLPYFRCHWFFDNLFDTFVEIIWILFSNLLIDWENWMLECIFTKECNQKYDWFKFVNILTSIQFEKKNEYSTSIFRLKYPLQNPKNIRTWKF